MAGEGLLHQKLLMGTCRQESLRLSLWDELHCLSRCSLKNSPKGAATQKSDTPQFFQQETSIFGHELTMPT